MTATAAAVLKAAGPEAPGELLRIPLAQLIESPWNPRKHFDPAKLAETAASLRANGQLTPITVRPYQPPKGLHLVDPGPHYEIGAGHRRFRAAKQIGLSHLLAVVRPLDDVAFLELLTIENKQREDVTPLDEAAGFQLLMTKAGYDVAKLAARIGLSTNYVYDRLKLLQLIPAAKQLLEGGRITAGHAILLARLAPSEQQRAIGKPSRGGSGEPEGGLFRAERAPNEELPLKDQVTVRSVRELGAWIDDHVRQRPEAIDPFLFPETADALKIAKEEALKVVHITHDFLAKWDVRDADKARVYGSASWKRADGEHRSKKCAYVAMGVVVSGEGRGEAFLVCVRRDKCPVHWPARKKKRAATGGTQQDSWAVEAARRQRTAERERQEKARWKQATPALVRALTEKVRTLPLTAGGVLWRAMLRECTPRRRSAGFAPGRTLESLVRHCVFQHIMAELTGYVWNPASEVPRLLNPFGIDAGKIVDQVAPKPAPEKTPAKQKAKT